MSPPNFYIARRDTQNKEVKNNAQKNIEKAAAEL